MKNICFFNSTKFWGGGEKLHLEYAHKFRNKGYNVILASNKLGHLYAKGQGLNLKSIHVKAGNLSFLNPVKVSEISALFKKNDVDTVFFSTSQDAKLGGIAAKKAGVKNIVYLRGLAVPIKASPINKYLFKKVFTHFLVNSMETGEMMKKRFKKDFPEEKIKVIYHGIDLNEYDSQIAKQILQRKEGEIIIGNAGRLTRQKGQDLLVEVARILKDKGVKFKVIIAGTGELEGELQSKIKEYALEESVELLGFVSDIKSFMMSLDIFALSSLWEGFGYVIVEAMAANNPVVAFNTSSNPEIILDKETGFLVSESDTIRFADRIIELIHNKELRKAMANKARKSVEERFELNDRINEIEAYLND